MIKNILYIWAMGMGDSILSIPFFLKLKQKWYKITLLRYHARYFWKHFHYSTDEIINLLKDNNLIDDILLIPYNKISLLLFIFKNLLRFDIVYIPTKTFFSMLWAKLLGKKQVVFFQNINNNQIYSGLVQGLLQSNNTTNLFSYRERLNIQTDSFCFKSYGIINKFITIYPSIFERSINASEWSKIISFIENKWLQVVFIGWEREKRLYKDLISYKHKNIIDLCWKTNLKTIMSILSSSEVNISANGGIMWLWHLLNKNNISFHTTSWFITEPPVNNIHSFNIRKYTYPCCKPCEPFYYRFAWKEGIPCCVFAWTKREGECRKSITWDNIITYLKKILH